MEGGKEEGRRVSLQVVRVRGHVEPNIGEKQKEGKKEKEWNKKGGGRGKGEK